MKVIVDESLCEIIAQSARFFVKINCVNSLDDYLQTAPMVPFIRESDFAVRRPWMVAQRRLLDYLLIFVQEGECVVECNEVEHTFRKGEWCLLQPSDVIVLRGLTDTITPFAHFDLFWNARREESFPAPPGMVDLSPFEELVQPRLNDFDGICLPTKLQVENATWFRDTFLRVVGVWQARDAWSRLEAQNGLASLFLSLLRTSSTRSESSAPQNLNWITSYLLLHLSETLRVEDMARRARLSPSRFATLFRQTFGCAPHQYLMRLRLNHAQELLARSDESLSRIAQLSGFSDVHHFAKTFKQHCGQTPRAWRIHASMNAQSDVNESDVK